MPTKIASATKQSALQYLREGLMPKEVSALTGVSLRTIQGWKSKLQKSGMPAGNTPQMASVSQAQMHATNTEEEAQEDRSILDFEDSPAPIEEKSLMDSAWSSLKGMIGIKEKDKEEETARPPISGKLDAKRQAFVDAISPTAALALILLSSWLWKKVGEEYGELAPDEKTAQRIMEPLLRIYARHSKFMVDINPDFADFSASMLALAGYVRVSIKLYEEIKRDQEYEDEDYRVRQFRQPERNSAAESRTGQQSSGQTTVFRQYRTNDPATRGNVRNGDAFNPANLSEKEAAQHAALSRLSALDYQHRARRAFRAA